MTQATPEITLMGFLGMGPVTKVARTRLFGGPFIRFADYMNVSSFLYQSGAVIGRAKRHELIIMAKMFAEPGREGDVTDWLQDLARKRLDEYVEIYGQQPRSFPIFIRATEYKKAGIIMPVGDVAPPTYREFTVHMKLRTKVAQIKMSLKDMEPIIKHSVLEGIGFGSHFPELTETMYREANENIDMDQWSEARKYGLNIPETPTLISLEEQEQTVLRLVAIYAGTYFPELVEPLDLTDILRQAETNEQQSN